MKRLMLLPLILLAACSSNPPLPMPSGATVPINSLATSEMLAHKSGFVVVGEQRHEPALRQHLLNRLGSPDDYATVPGGQLVERTVTVPFPYGSARFRPTPQQAFQIMQVLAVADRVELRGRTDSIYNTPDNERMAKLRALAARHYLIDRGMPSELIAVNYMATGDPIASNDNRAGRAQNRRVELEFFIDEFTVSKINKVSGVKPDECSKVVNINEWQNVGESSNNCTN